MTDAYASPKDRPLRGDNDLRDVIELLLQRANQRQMWLLFIDDRGCLGEPVMPMADYPDDPDELTHVDDLGMVSHAHVLMHRAALFCEVTGNAALIVVWERPGSRSLRPEDRLWARAMHRQAATLGAPLRAQFVLHDHGVRQLHPDDYL